MIGKFMEILERNAFERYQHFIGAAQRSVMLRQMVKNGVRTFDHAGAKCWTAVKKNAAGSYGITLMVDGDGFLIQSQMDSVFLSGFIQAAGQLRAEGRNLRGFLNFCLYGSGHSYDRSPEINSLLQIAASDPYFAEHTDMMLLLVETA